MLYNIIQENKGISMNNENSTDIDPFKDGADHINIYSKARTKLGKRLSNFDHSPFKHTKYGNFESVEGFWYWLATGKKHDELRKLYGINAKKKGQEIAKEFGERTLFDQDDIEDILEAIRCKLRQNKDILNMLIESELPFEHYYCWYGKNNDSYKLEKLSDSYWIVDEFERIRKVCKEKYLK
jgi:hypothetical protein